MGAAVLALQLTVLLRTFPICDGVGGHPVAACRWQDHSMLLWKLPD